MAYKIWKPAKSTLRQALIGKQREARTRLGLIVKNLFYSTAHESGARSGFKQSTFSDYYFSIQKTAASKKND